MKNIIITLLPVLLCLNFINCNSNNSSNNFNNQNNSDNNNNNKIINGERLIPDYLIPEIKNIYPNDNYLYLGTTKEIIQYNKSTGSRRTLGGLIDQFNNESNLNLGYWPKNMTVYQNYLYFTGSGEGKIKKLYIGNDGKSSIETLVPPEWWEISSNNFSISCNDQKIFWSNSDGYYSYIISKNINQDKELELELIVDGDCYLKAVPNYLYVGNRIGISTNSSTLNRYNITTNSFTSLQTDITINSYGNLPMASSDSFLFWGNGDKIYYISHLSENAELLASGFSNILYLSGNDSTLYVADRINYDVYNIYKIDIESKICNKILETDDINGLIFYKNNLYWTSAWTLYRLNADYSTSELCTTNEQMRVFGNIYAVGNKIIIQSKLSSGMTFYDLDTFTSNWLNPFGTTAKPATNSNSLYLGGGDGIRKIPLDLNYRIPEVVSDIFYNIQQMIIHDDWIYIYDDFNNNNIHRISRIQINGSSPNVLYETSGTNSTLRDIVIYNNQLYFTTIYNNNWVLASIPLEGGDIKYEYILNYGPANLKNVDGIFYLADATQPISDYVVSIFSINLNLNDYFEIVNGLYGKFYDYSGLESSFGPLIKVSSNYLYYRECINYLYVEYKLKRKKINTWCNFDPSETIENDLVEFYAYESDNSYLYYWYEDGLYRLSEK